MEKSFRIMPRMCKQQRDDINSILEAADEIAAAATSMSALGAQGYSAFVDARDSFRKMAIQLTSKYCLVIEDEETTV